MTDDTIVERDPGPAPTAATGGPHAGEIPPPLADHRGRPLLLATTGALNGRTVLLTDLPAVYVHESAGLVRQERVRAYEGYDLSRDEIVFAKCSAAVRADLRLDGIGRLQFETMRYTDAVATGLPPAAPSHVTALPVSVDVAFDDRGEGRDRALNDARAALDVDGGPWAALDELSKHNELYAHVALHDNTLVLVKKRAPICVVPLGSHVSFDRGIVRVAARVTCAELAVSSLTIHLPSSAVMERLRTTIASRIAVADGSGVGEDAAGLDEERAADRDADDVTIGAVLVTGVVDGRDLRNADGQLVVADDHLAITVGGASHRFRLDDPDVRVGGGALDLLVADGDHGPLSVSAMGPDLQARLAGHVELRTAATRTVGLGPHPCRVDGRVAMVAIAAGNLIGRPSSAAGAGSVIEVPLAELGEPVVVKTDDGAEVTFSTTADRPPIVVRSALPIMAEIYRQIRAGTAAARHGRDIAHILPTIVALEGEYLLYTVLGPLVEAHRLLLAEHGVHPSDGDALGVPLPSPGDEATETFGSALVDAATQVEQHLDRVLHQLPTFLTTNDASAEPADQRSPLTLKALEPRYRAALAPLRLLASHASAVHEPLRSALAVLGVETAPSYGSAILTGVAGVVMSPVFLFTSASQVLGAKKSAGRIAAEKQGSASRAVQRSTERWNRLVLDTGPDIVGPVLDALFPIRWETANRLASRLEHDGRLPDSIAPLHNRLATLETFLALPASGSTAGSRQCVVDELHQRLATVDATEHFTPF